MSEGDKARDKAWEKRKQFAEARQKLDYFITGISAALLAYSIQSFDKGDYDKYVFIAPLAWAILILAVYAGIKRIELFIQILDIEAKQVSHEETLVDCVRRLREVQEARKDVGNLSHPDDAQNIKNINNAATRFFGMLDVTKSKVSSYYWLYNQNIRLLIIGIVLLGILKMLNLTQVSQKHHIEQQTQIEVVQPSPTRERKSAP